jgi:N-acyl-D-aspartate/D-glutamate deacylase
VYITFQPNTIVYAVPANSKLAKQILRSKIGVVWHTMYTGDSFETMKASFGQAISTKLSTPASVWHTDATFKDVSGAATFTDAETKALTAVLSRAGIIFNTIPAATLNDISENDEFLMRVKTYNNSKVRAGEKITNTTAHVTGLMNFIHNYYQNEANKKKTDKGKQVQLDKQKEMLRYFTNHSKHDIVKVFDLMNLMVDCKDMVIRKLNMVQSLRTFLRTTDGFRTTSPEGYVAIDHIGNAVKLVDRLEFSKANFSPDIIKGWQK